MMLIRPIAGSVLMMLLLGLILCKTVLADASKLQISSPAISQGATIPIQFTCSGEDQSPPLNWTGIPSNAKSLVLIVEDPDAPSGTFVHWVVYDIPPTSSGSASGAVAGQPGLNSTGKAAYMGPCPPPGNPHHYHFELFSLDMMLNLNAPPRVQTVRAAMQGHIIQSVELVGTFGR